MNFLVRASVLLLMAVPLCCDADECFADEVEAHVLEQFSIFGPFSTDREYFGFIYRHEGVIASAVSRGGKCRGTQSCGVRTRAAAALIPKGARVLGEWHTHPRAMSAQNLSPEDVRGAYNNRHFHCYRAFYSESDGDIHSWNPHESSVLRAMASTVRLGSYRQLVAPALSAAVQ